MKRFNVTGTCYPDKHYMVDISARLEIIAQMVGRGDYFCINAGRQYGKTTTLSLLKDKLDADYCVFSLSFEGLSDRAFDSIERLGYSFIQLLSDCIDFEEVRNISPKVCELIQQNLSGGQGEYLEDRFSVLISKMNKFSEKPIVIIIDEVDQAGNFPVFIKFLGLLRELYLKRNVRPTFQSVILAGVYDIKNLKLKIRPESEHQYSSPWNIAARFDVDMSLPADGIERMIAEYKADHTGIPEADCMDTYAMAHLIYDYTSGYPFLVSRLCQILDEQKLRWDKNGFLEATKIIYLENNTIFDDMLKKLDNFPELSNTLQAILYRGETFTFNPDNKVFNLAKMFGFIRLNANGKAAISNRIFETRLYNYFSSKEESSKLFSMGSIDKNQFIQNGQIDIEHLLSRFAVHFNDIYGREDGKFVEEKGRKLFLLYLKPIINGVGNYYIEAQTRDETRTDIIIDYLGHQYIIELKIWRGNAYNERGEEQIAGYLDLYHAKKGYLVSFCFNKNKETGVKSVWVGDKEVVECVV